MAEFVTMIALRRFPLAQGETSRRIVPKGEEYEIDATEVAFHEGTGRGKRKAQPKSGKKEPK